MDKKPWWKQAFQFLRELLCHHKWRPLDGSFSNWRFCHKCEKTVAPRWGRSIMVPVLKDWLIWNACQRAGHQETKHEDLASRVPSGIKPPHGGL